MGKTNQVAVRCAICSIEWSVKASRAAQNNSITCSKSCLAELRRRNNINYRGSAETRQATCPVCEQTFVRKPSQIAKYGQSYCGRACRAIGIRGPRPGQRTGEWLACETCAKNVWRTEATKRPHTYCSRACAGKGPRTPRVARVIKPCDHCGASMTRLPCEARRYRFCSLRCAARTVQGARRGKPGTPWPPAQRELLTATLLRKYQNEWMPKRRAQSVSMSGAGNPQWQNGRSLQGYAPGFTRTLKRRIRIRDGHKCQICGIPSEPGTHAVHHIDGQKVDHSPSNLVLLCHSCHRFVHSGKLSLPLTPEAR